VDLKQLAELTKNFSGAEIEGLVKAASSFALFPFVNVQADSAMASADTSQIIVTMQHFMEALSDIDTPAFGVSETELKALARGELYDWGPEFTRIMDTANVLLKQVQNSEQTPLMSFLLEGESGSGMTAIAAAIATRSNFPYMKVISPEHYLGYNEASKCASIAKIFEDAYKSPLSLIIVDNIERLLEYVAIGPRFSNQVLQTLLVVLKRIPPVEGRKLMVIATTSSVSILRDMEMKSAFKVVQHVPQLSKPAQVLRVMDQIKGLSTEPKEAEKIANSCAFPIGIKQLIDVFEMARQTGQNLTQDRFVSCLKACGLYAKYPLEDSVQ